MMGSLQTDLPNILKYVPYSRYIYISILVVVLNIVLLLLYVTKAFSYLATETTNEAPLNIEAMDYLSIYSLTFLNGDHNFSLTYFFVIFLAIAFISLAYFMLRTRYMTKLMTSEFSGITNDIDFDNTIKIRNIALLALIGLFVAVSLQILITYFLGKNISNVKVRTDKMNDFIRNKIYKKGDFLNSLRANNKSIVDTDRIMTSCLEMVKNEKDVNSLAKAFYTLTLYNYYQEFSSKNTAISGAYDVFDLTAILNNTIQPSSYMLRYGTFIEGIGDRIIRPNMPRSGSYVNDAMNLCDMWISQTNEYANTIYPSEAYNSFMLMLVLTIVINVLLISTVYHYGKRRYSTVDFTAK